MTVSVEVKINFGVARGSLSRELARTVGPIADQIGRDMVDEANTLMETKYDLNRPFNRRRSPGTRRAATALDYQVEGGRELPVIVSYRVLGGEEVFLRILGLNYGVGAHTISPSGAWPLGGGARRTAAGPGTIRRNPRFLVVGRLAWPDALLPGGWRVVNGSVQWTPGANAGGGRFLEEAAQYAANRAI